MPDQVPPPPGLYQQLLTEGLEQQLSQLASDLYDRDQLDPQEAPRLLARHLAGLARIALEHLSGGANPEHQLALVNQLLGLLQSQAPRAISTADLLHPSARLLADPSIGSRTQGLLAVIETPEAMEGYLLRAQSQDDAKRRAHRCLEAAQEVARLVNARGWLRAANQTG
jgi:hypothetical protein